MFNFSAGRARLIPAGGTTSGAELGVVQSASLELKVDLKELRGAFRYPIAVADGKGTASGKVNFAQLYPQNLAQITGGSQNTSGAYHAAIAESHVIPASTPFTVTLTNAATFYTGSEIVTLIDSTGSPQFYSRVASGPASSGTAGAANGTYTIAAGVLTFAAGDAGRTVQITYEYQPAADINDNTVALTQVGMNTATTFQLTLIGVAAKNIYTNVSQQFIIQLNACLAPSLKLDFKLDDFTYADLDFEAFIDVNGNLGNFYLVNVGG
jgi:hypothetical protein